MTIVSTHSYFNAGLEKGRSQQHLQDLMSKAHHMQRWGTPYIHSIVHLSHLSNSRVELIKSIVDRKEDFYTAYTIPKRSGGSRFIHAPNAELKSLQRWINTEILYRLPVHNCCFSYHRDSSIIDCAKKHCASRWLIKFDIENFFHTIKEVDVYKVFRMYGYKPLISFMLARICTYQPKSVIENKLNWILFNTKSDDLVYSKKHVNFFGRVPQGAPTSPMLSNLVLRELDETLNQYAQKRGGIYSRYADDMFISFSQDNFDRKQASQVIGRVFTHVREYGYNLNKTKIKVIPPGQNKVILGLNVNGRDVLLTREFKQRIESHIYGIKRFGVKEHMKYRGFNSIYGMIEHIFGLINYARQVDFSYGEIKHIELTEQLQATGLWS